MPSSGKKIIVIVGPTATGKSALAVRLARAINGEIISADSRQIYKGLNIGSGKITESEMRGIPHHLLDVASPKKVFTVAQFQKAGQKAINEIVSRGKTPIICGGSGFYIQTLVDSMTLPDVPPNRELRIKLEKKTTAELCRILKKLDRRRYREIDKSNPRRLVRAIEIAKTLGKVPKIKKDGDLRNLYDPLFIGLTLAGDELKKKIKRRLDSRLRQGMIAEAKELRKNGVSWKRLESFGLEYRAVADFLRNSARKGANKKVAAEKNGISKNTAEKEMVAKLEKDIWQFAKRQMAWFKRDKRIRWFNPQNPREFQMIKNVVREFLAD